MGTFGERLRREREMRGITLDEIATATKIGTRSLRALEEEEFSKLPGGIFNKGFVRAYAKFLGINEEQAVADYVTAAGEQEQSSEVVIEKLAAESERRAEERRIQRQRESTDPPFTWNTIAIVVVLIAAAVLGWQYYSRQKTANTQQPGRTATAATAAPPVVPPTATPSNGQPTSTTLSASAQNLAQPISTAAPAAAPQSAPETAQTAQASRKDQSSSTSSVPATEQFTVVVKAKKTSWLSSQADGDSRSQRMLPPNSEATFRARNNLKLVIGNAGGVEISFNGRPLSFVGEENKSKTLVFTPEGLQE